jgi:glycine cleavage system H protein
MVAILFVISFVLLLAVGYFVDKKSHAITAKPSREGTPDFVRTIALPKGIFLSAGHAWAEVMLNGRARVGVDDFVRKLVGTIDSVQVLPVNSAVTKGQPLCTLRQADRTLTIRAPLSGTIVDVNPLAVDSHSSLNSDSYAGGWLAVVEPTDLASEIKLMRVAEDASRWLKGELRRFRDFILNHTESYGSGEDIAIAGQTLLDGGAPLAGLLRNVRPDTWKIFEQKFLILANHGPAEQ